MAGTRTAPDPSLVSETSAIVTLHLVDASGDNYTDAYKLGDAPTGAQLEALAAAYQAASNASLWNISVYSEWEGAQDPDNAVAAYRANVESGINMLWKNPTANVSFTPRLIAPIASVMEGNLDIPLASAAEFVALVAAQQTILPAYALESVQYTGRTERKNNPRVKT